MPTSSPSFAAGSSVTRRFCLDLGSDRSADRGSTRVGHVAYRAQRSTSHLWESAFHAFLVREPALHKTWRFRPRRPTHQPKRSILAAKPHILNGGETERSPLGIRPAQLQELLSKQPGGPISSPSLHHLRSLKARSCPESTPQLRVNLLRIFLDPAINSNCFLVQMLQLAH